MSAKVKATQSKLQHASKIIAEHVGWFNGWHASEKAFDDSCKRAARNVLRYSAQYEKRRKPPVPAKAPAPKEKA